MNAIFLSDVFFKWTLLNALFVQVEFAARGAHVTLPRIRLLNTENKRKRVEVLML